MEEVDLSSQSNCSPSSAITLAISKIMIIVTVNTKVFSVKTVVTVS